MHIQEHITDPLMHGQYIIKTNYAEVPAPVLVFTLYLYNYTPRAILQLL